VADQCLHHTCGTTSCGRERNVSNLYSLSISSLVPLSLVPFSCCYGRDSAGGCTELLGKLTDQVGRSRGRLSLRLRHDCERFCEVAINAFGVLLSSGYLCSARSTEGDCFSCTVFLVSLSCCCCCTNDARAANPSKSGEVKRYGDTTGLAREQDAVEDKNDEL
jgi:hypothetical protein